MAMAAQASGRVSVEAATAFRLLGDEKQVLGQLVCMAAEALPKKSALLSPYSILVSHRLQAAGRVAEALSVNNTQINECPCSRSISICDTMFRCQTGLDSRAALMSLVTDPSVYKCCKSYRRCMHTGEVAAKSAGGGV